MREGPSDRRANGRQAESELGSHFTRNALKQPDLRLPAAFFRSLLGGVSETSREPCEREERA